MTHRLRKADWRDLKAISHSRGFGFDTDFLPHTGLRDGNCFGFLYLSGKVGHLDSFICPTGLSSEEKQRSFGRIFRGLGLLARFKGIRIVVGHTPHSNLKESARLAGYKVLENNSSYLRLEIR